MHLHSSGPIFFSVYVLGAGLGSVRALLTKPDPRSALSWIALCSLVPYGGVVLYIVFGINQVRLVVNPDTIAAQMEGGALFGLTAALYGEITLKKGRVVQSNFHDYRPMRINEAPILETHVVQSSEPPGGVGEVPTATVSPAVTNVVFAATGKRIRRLPIKGLDVSPER